MCGRYSLSFDFLELLDRLDKTFPSEKLNWQKKYNITPSTDVPVLVMSHQKIDIQLKTWGLKSGQFQMINARSETLFQKPFFKNAAKNHCVIPVTSFFEWKAIEGKKKKKPYLIKLKNRDLFYFAGIYLGQSFCIVTTGAKKSIESVHHRMPVILDDQEVMQWLESSDQNTSQFKNMFSDQKDLDFEFYPVSEAVNSPKNDDPRLLDEYVDLEDDSQESKQLNLLDES